MAEDYPPANFVEKGELKGISVELLKLIWSKLGVEEQPIVVVPWARGYHYITHLDNQVLFTMALTKERKDLFKWLGPVFTTRQVIIARAESDVIITSLNDARKYVMGVNSNDVTERILLEKDFPVDNISQSNSIKQNLNKLDKKRVDCVVYSEHGFKRFLQLNNISEEQYRVVFILEETQQYIAFSKNVSDSLMKKLNSTLQLLSKEHKDILSKYSMILTQ